MVESRKAITAGVRRGKSLDADSCDPGNDRSDVNVSADTERPRGELDEEVGPRMLVAVADRVEADGFHDRIQLYRSDRRLEDEVEVGGLILSLTVNRRASSTGQNSADLGAREGLRDTGCDFGQAGA
jgi:hypothetical protein